MKMCIYGGHYGSEGKGAAAEYWIRQSLAANRPVLAIGENSPNSGHTCSLGKTRNIPASSFFAHAVILGPDAIIDPEVLAADLLTVRAVNPHVKFYVHENTGWMDEHHKLEEQNSSLERRIGSTLSGSGVARTEKYLRRQLGHVASYESHARWLASHRVGLVAVDEWPKLLEHYGHYHWFFECSQGVLLDTNWGTYPYVTSRTTLPQVAIARNGLGHFYWRYAGVYRTYPIRTGGASGPTGGREIKYEDIGVPSEIATVTKRTRRIFEFNAADFHRSVALSSPEIIMFTHLDYLLSAGALVSTHDSSLPHDFRRWLLRQSVHPEVIDEVRLFVSSHPSQFVEVDRTEAPNC